MAFGTHHGHGHYAYVDGLKDAQFIDGVKRVALYMVIQVPVMLVLALVFALIGLGVAALIVIIVLVAR